MRDRRDEGRSMTSTTRVYPVRVSRTQVVVIEMEGHDAEDAKRRAQKFYALEGDSLFHDIASSYEDVEYEVGAPKEEDDSP